MSSMDYCWWSAGEGGKCWYQNYPENPDQIGLCTFHHAFAAGDVAAMADALLDNEWGRPPNGIALVNAVRNPDGSWDLTFRAQPDRGA